MRKITDMLQNRKKILLITAFIIAICGFICGGIWYFMAAGQKREPYAENRLTGSGPGAEEQSDALEQWLMKCAEEDGGENILCLAVPDTEEMFYIDLSSERQSSVCYLRGSAFSVNGWMNCERGFFDGSVEPGESDIYMVNLATMEYRLLTEELRSFFLGDYYVSCRYAQEHARMELLIFFCPEK